MSLVEDKIRNQVSQVVTGLINQKFNVIIVINLVIMHMNVGISGMTKEGKAKISGSIPTLRPTQYCSHAHSQLSAM